METDTIRKCSEILGEEAPGIVSTGYPELDASLAGGWRDGRRRTLIMIDLTEVPFNYIQMSVVYRPVYGNALYLLFL